jgi:hypothetical protein
MGDNIAFELLHLYDAGKPGITIPVLLRSGGLSVDVTTKLDTGASDCIFERFYGEELKLDIESGSRQDFSAATGTFTAYGNEATLSVLGFDFDVTIYFAAHEAFNRNVLGRRGFLDRVLLGLNDYEGKLYLSRGGSES